MISCVIVDDEQVAREGMKLLVDQVDFLEIKGVFSNVIEADQFLKKDPVDILFLDIHMPRLDGMEYLKLKQNKSLVILTTAFTDQAINAFDNGAVDYLLKPIRFERFYKAVLKAMELLENRKLKNNGHHEPINADKHFFIKHERKILRLNYSDILFIEGLKDYSLIHTQDKRVDVPMNLKTIEKLFPSELFIRVSKSHIINTSYLTHVESDHIQLSEHSITLSPLYKNDFYDRVINKNFFRKR
jgi:two-component system, LytTR family, response regulator